MAKKAELQDKLEEMGVDYDENATNAQLEQLIEDNTPEEDEADEASDDVQEESSDDGEDSDEEEAPKSKSKAVDVLQKHADYMEYIRTYSEDVHGKDYKKLAETFISDRKGCVLADPKDTKSLIVSYEAKNSSGVLERKVKVFGGATMRQDALEFKNRSDRAYVMVSKD